MIERYGEWILRWRWLVLLVTVLTVLGVASGGRFLQFTNDYRVFFSEDNPQLAAFEDLQDTYIKNDNVLIMLLPKSGDVMESTVLQAVTELTEAAWQTPYSTRVDSLSNYQHTQAEGDDLLVQDLIEDPASLSGDTITAKHQIAVNEPLLVNRTISPDAKATGVNITVELPNVDPTSEIPEVVVFTRELVAEFEAKYPQIEFYTTGIVIMNNAFAESSQNDMTTLVPLAFGVIMLGLLLFLKTFTGTLGAFILVIFSIMLAMGTTGWLGIKLTPPSVSAPTLILTLAVADSIHFLTTMLFMMRKGHAKNQAIIESLRINFNPIFLTSLTTAIGFLSMNFSDSPPFHDLGNITAMGVMFAFVLSVTFLPALMSILPVKVPEKKSSGSILMEKLADFVINYRKASFIGVGILIAVLALMIPRNELNDTFVNYFDESIQFRAHTDKVTDNLTGMYLIEYSLDAKTTGGISNPEFQQQLEAFANWFREQPEIRHVTVITDVFKRLNKNLHADEAEWYRIPDSRELAAQYLLLYEMSLPYGLDLNNQINIDKSTTRMTVLLNTITSKQTLELEQRAFQWMEQNTPDILTLGASPTIMFSHIGMRNIKSMLTGTTIALVLISLVLIFALRSLKMGLISLIPNLAPAAVAFGVWGLLVGEVGLALSVVAAMTLGIVVDDTVHFLSKYLRARREQGLSAEDAVRYAFSSVGLALAITTTVLVAGFMVLYQSAFQINSGMGLLTALTIAIALFIDFFFLPPLLIFLDKDKKPETVLTPAEQTA